MSTNKPSSLCVIWIEGQRETQRKEIKMRKQSRNQVGQTTVEYLLIIAVIVVVISVFGKGMRDKLPVVVDQVFSGVQTKIQTLFEATK